MNTLHTIAASFGALRVRNLRIYLIGQAISLIGTWLQVTAQGWVVWKLTGSTAELGLATMLSSLPIFILGPWAGVWADRYDRRKMLIITQVGAMFLAFILAALVLTDTIQVWHIYVLAFLLGIISAIDFPTQQAFLGDISGMDMVRKAVNLNVTIVQTSRVLGPAIAGAVIGLVGAGSAFVLNGFSFLAVVISLVIVRASQVQNRGNGQSAMQGFASAVAFIRSQPRLRDCILFVMMVTFFGFSIILTILPAVASEVLKGDASTLGLLMSASGLGSLVGTVVVAPLVQQRKRVGVVLGYAVMFGASCLLLLGFTNVLPVAIFALFMTGLAFPAVITTVMGILQFNAPPTMRARVMSLFTMVSFGLQPIASLWIGWSAEHFGIQQAIVINASALLTGALLMLSRSHLRQWQMSQEQPFVQQPAAPTGD